MPTRNSLVVDIRLNITFIDPIALSEFAGERIKALLSRGIYILREGECSLDEFDPLAQEVKYIGKAIGETIFSRCQKHLLTITDARNANGNPKTRPGTRFINYRVNRNFQADGLYVYPAPMLDSAPYLVSCAEELLLYRYAQQHCDIPAANTKR